MFAQFPDWSRDLNFDHPGILFFLLVDRDIIIEIGFGSDPQNFRWKPNVMGHIAFHAKKLKDPAPIFFKGDDIAFREVAKRGDPGDFSD